VHVVHYSGWRRRRLTVGVVVVGLTMIAACGSDKKSTSTSATGSTASSATTVASGAATTAAGAATTAAAAATTAAAAATTAAAAATTAAAAATTVGGASASGGGTRTGTIELGFTNNEGGAFSLPEFRYGFEVGIKRLNDTGGINGAKINIHFCAEDATPEGAVNCANKMVEDKVVATQAGLDVASDAMLPILDGARIPYISAQSWGNAQKMDPNAHILHSANDAFFLGAFKVFADKGLKKAAIFVEDTPAGRQATVAMAAAATKVGITSTQHTVDPANPDWGSAIAAAVADGPDMIYSSLSEPGCIGMVTAAKQAGFKGSIVAGSCNAYIQALGKDSIGTFTHIDVWTPDSRPYAPAAVQAQLDQYAGDMQASGHADQVNSYGQTTYAAALELGEILKTIPASTPITNESITAALDSAKGIKGVMGGDLDCTKHAFVTEPRSCRGTIMVYEVVAGADGNPVRKPATADMQDVTALGS
jgi:branched-chain amino acid transport system substrate-binding protein